MKVTKTIKLFINGEFPRTESGRSYPIYHSRSKKEYARLCQASRKDLRNTVSFAKAAQKKWSQRTAYNRGQILYRIAEMMEGKRDEIATVLNMTQGLSAVQSKTIINSSIDHFVHFAGMSDKYEQILGSKNPVNGPFHNFSSPSPVGVVSYLTSNEESLDSLCEKIAATVVTGNSLIILLGSKTEALLSTLGEILKTSDLPNGVVNLLTGRIEELVAHFFSHMEINATNYSNLKKDYLTQGKIEGASHLKRINNLNGLNSISLLEKAIDYKTYWHPIGQ